MHAAPVASMGLAVTLLVSAAWAEEVSVGLGDHLAPYIVPEAGTGFEVEVFREALAHSGHVMKPVFLPIKRAATMFADGKLDAAMMDSGIDLAAKGGLYADPAVVYDNVFIALSDRHLAVRSPADLRGLSVLAFPGALTRYPDWLSEVDKAGKYRETNNQILQVLSLRAGEFDVVLSDRYVFRYYAVQLRRRRALPAFKTTEYPVIVEDPRDYRAVFRNPTVKADYEAGLRFLRESGRYAALFSQYVGCLSLDDLPPAPSCLGGKLARASVR